MSRHVKVPDSVLQDLQSSNPRRKLTGLIDSTILEHRRYGRYEDHYVDRQGKRRSVILGPDVVLIDMRALQRQLKSYKISQNSEAISYEQIRWRIKKLTERGALELAKRMEPKNGLVYYVHLEKWPGMDSVNSPKYSGEKKLLPNTESGNPQTHLENESHKISGENRDFLPIIEGPNSQTQKEKTPKLK